MYTNRLIFIFLITYFSPYYCQYSLGGDNSVVSVYSTQGSRSLGITVSMSFYNSSIYSFRLVLDFEPWGGNYQSFGSCENIANGKGTIFINEFLPLSLCSSVGIVNNTYYPLILPNHFGKICHVLVEQI